MAFRGTRGDVRRIPGLLARGAIRVREDRGMLVPAISLRGSETEAGSDGGAMSGSSGSDIGQGVS